MHDPQPPLQKSCIQAQALLVDMMPESFQADSMPDADNLAFLERHLLDCAACQAYQEDMAMLTASIAELEEVPVPDGLADRIMQKIGQEAPAQVLGDDTALPAPPELVLARQSQPIRTTSKVVSFRWGKAVPIAAAVLLLALVVPTVLKNMPQQAPAPEVAVKPAVHQVAPVAQSTNSNPVAEQAASTSDAQIASASSDETVVTQPVTPMRATLNGETQADASSVKVAVQPHVTPLTAPSTKTSRAASSQRELDTADLVASVPDMTSENGELYEEDPVSNLVGY